MTESLIDGPFKRPEVKLVPQCGRIDMMSWCFASRRTDEIQLMAPGSDLKKSEIKL
jgi:hypothetical protein